MKYYLETTDIDLGDTPIENIFINDFMPQADGTYVKVYLLGYKYAQDKDLNLKMNNETLSKHLRVPLSDILGAWDYWEEKGIIKKHFNEENEYDYEVEFLNLKQLYINNILMPNKTKEETLEHFVNPSSSTTEELIEAKNTPIINDMFNNIRIIMKRYITPNEYKRVYDWIDTFNMTPDIIVRAFEYSSEKKNKRTLSFIEGILRNWHDEGVTNLEALENYYKKKDYKYYRYNRIMRSLGLNELPSDIQKKYIDKWFDVWNFELEIILRACDETIKIRKPSFPYIDKILFTWYNEGVKNVVDVDKRQEKYTSDSESSKVGQDTKNKKNIKTSFHNFEQTTSKYTEEELEKKLMSNFHNDI